MSFLRVCINLTNSCGEICEYLDPDLELSTILASVIASDPQRYSNADYRRESDSDSDHLPSAHEAKHEERESRFEVLLLSLGLMINFVQESDTVKDLILSSPIPNGIIHIFEKLVCRDVIHQSLPSIVSHRVLGTCQSCFGIPRFITCPFNDPLSRRQGHFCKVGYEGKGRETVG